MNNFSLLFSKIFLPSIKTVLGRYRYFFRFSIIGTFGILWDSVAFYCLKIVTSIWVAAIISYVFSATINWIFNRLWTFSNINAYNDKWIKQWLIFLLTNIVGFIFNRTIVFLLFVFVPVLQGPWAIIALIAGSLSGSLSNFHLSRKIVYRSAPVKKTH